MALVHGTFAWHFDMALTHGTFARRSCPPNSMEGPTTFLANSANWGGAIMNVETQNGRYADDDAEEVEVPTISYPDDTVFINNSAQVGHC